MYKTTVLATRDYGYADHDLMAGKYLSRHRREENVTTPIAVVAEATVPKLACGEKSTKGG